MFSCFAECISDRITRLFHQKSVCYVSNFLNPKRNAQHEMCFMCIELEHVLSDFDEINKLKIKVIIV